MIEIKRIQQQPDLAQAIYAVMADVTQSVLGRWNKSKQTWLKTRLGMLWLMMGQK